MVDSHLWLENTDTSTTPATDTRTAATYTEREGGGVNIGPRMMSISRPSKQSLSPLIEIWRVETPRHRLTGRWQYWLEYWSRHTHTYTMTVRGELEAHLVLARE